MQKFLLYIFSALILFSSCGKGGEETDPTKILSRHWNLVTEGESNNFIKLVNKEGVKTFTASIHKKDTIKGSWEFNEKDSIITLIPVTPNLFSSHIDSVVTETDTSGTRLCFYSNGFKELTYTGGKLVNHRVEIHYEVLKMSKNHLQLQSKDGSNEIIEFSYTAPVHPSFLSAEGVTRGLIGILFLVIICYLLSSNRGGINWRLVITGLSIQIVFALLVLKVPFVEGIFESISGFFVKVISFANEGANFLFRQFSTGKIEGPLINFVVMVLPTIIFFSALTSLLYYLGVLQKIVFVFAWLMKKTMRMSGAESMAAAGNIFLGQTEAPLLVKPYIEGMTKSELLCLMSGGMATIAGGVLAAYIGFLGGDDPEAQLYFAKHLLAASVMSAPAAIVAAKMLLPETEEFSTKLEIPKEKIGANILEAISNGTTDGVKLAVNVGAMLLVFIAMVAMCNYILIEWIGGPTGLNDYVARTTEFDSFSFEYILGNIFAPVAYMLGVDKADMLLVGQLMGEKTIINEFYAYTSLGKMKEAGKFVSEKSVIISTYILCGFSNIASIGIQIGGIGAIAPAKKTQLAQLGVKALIAGTIACLFTATIVGMLI